MNLLEVMFLYVYYIHVFLSALKHKPTGSINLLEVICSCTNSGEEWRSLPGSPLEDFLGPPWGGTCVTRPHLPVHRCEAVGARAFLVFVVCLGPLAFCLPFAFVVLEFVNVRFRWPYLLLVHATPPLPPGSPSLSDLIYIQYIYMYIYI